MTRSGGGGEGVAESCRERRGRKGRKGRGDGLCRFFSFFLVPLWASALAPLCAKHNHFCRDMLFTAPARLGIRYENTLSALTLWLVRACKQKARARDPSGGFHPPDPRQDPFIPRAGTPVQRSASGVILRTLSRIITVSFMNGINKRYILSE